MTTAPNTITKPERTCSVDGCGRPFYARGWCSMHYLRWYRHGHPLGGLWWMAHNQRIGKIRREMRTALAAVREGAGR
jgi:hypothetical protein